MKKTPSPQSVVVPVELAETPAIRNTLGLLRSAVLCEEQWSDTCRDAYLAALKELDQLAMLAAAPAPSSLAGGDVWAALEPFAKVADTALCPSDEPDDNDFIRLDETIAITVADIRRAASVFAALSPEAPAREGIWPDELTPEMEQVWRSAFISQGHLRRNHAGRLKHPDSCEKAAYRALRKFVSKCALTPRHEALEMSLEDAKAFGIGFIVDGVRVSPDRVTACRGDEAPAEGAGEVASAARALLDACYKADENSDLSDFVDGMLLTRLDKALRARSSAPEAREEALGNLLAVIHGDGGHRALEVGTKQAALEAEKIVAGLFAAPSADKLRIAVEALERARDPLSTAKMWGKRKGGCDGAVDKIDRALWGIKQALAALKAGGAK